MPLSSRRPPKANITTAHAPRRQSLRQVPLTPSTSTSSDQDQPRQEYGRKRFLRKKRPLSDHHKYPPIQFVVMPVDSPPPYSSSSSTTIPLTAAGRSNSSPLLPSELSPFSYPTFQHLSAQASSESDADDRDDEPVFQSRSSAFKNSVSGLRSRAPVNGSSSQRPKTICTTPGALCAGETETEIDEPVRSHL